ncbi:MAG: sulfur carrier protein ThiS [Bacteroidales bacterium]|nr:sulfur carrier protein ThiS [Bacteroidales bacterium]
MRIKLNNRLEEIDEDVITLAELISYKNYSFHLLVTKVNNKLIKKEERAKTQIKNGDDVLVLHMISGG